MRRISVISLSSVIVGALMWFGVSCAAPDSNRGLDTTCGDFLGMTHGQQLAVMKTAGVLKGYHEEEVTYYLDGCRPHPEARNWRIGNIAG